MSFMICQRQLKSFSMSISAKLPRTFKKKLQFKSLSCIRCSHIDCAGVWWGALSQHCTGERRVGVAERFVHQGIQYLPRSVWQRLHLPPAVPAHRGNRTTSLCRNSYWHVVILLFYYFVEQYNQSVSVQRIAIKFNQLICSINTFKIIFSSAHFYFIHLNV